MRLAPVVACLFSCLALSASPGHAEIMVGGYLVSDPGNHPLSQFGASAQGNMAPNRQIAGPATQLREPHYGSYEPSQQLIYISDFRGEAIRVFPAFANGDVAPLRTINTPYLGQPRGNVPIVAHGELAVIGGCCVRIFPLDANSDSMMYIRGLSWGGNSPTELNNPSSLIYVPFTDEIAVLDSALAAPFARHILFFPRTANGGVAPVRRITGPNIADAVSMAYDPTGRRIFVLRNGQAQGAVVNGRIDVFSDTASGDAVPVKTIQGVSTQLQITPPDYFVGIGYDPYRNALMVSSAREGSPARNRIVTLDASGNGDLSPYQILEGTTLSPRTVGTPFGITSITPPVTPLLAIATPTQLAYGQTSALSFHGGSGSGAVGFSVTAGPGNCSIQNTTLTATGVGPCTVTATQAGNPQVASVNLTITQATQAPLTAFATPNELLVGGSSTLSAQGGSGTGAVWFQIDSGFESCTVQGNELVAVAPGTCTVRAYKAADANYYVISSPTVAVTVNAAPEVFGDGFETP